MEEFTEENSMEDFQLSEELIMKPMEVEELNFVKEDKHLFYVDINSRSIGLLLKYKEHQYLYRYPDGFESFVGGKLELLEKRIIDNQMDHEPTITDDEFRILEIIETRDGYIFCILLRYLCSNAQFMISNNLQLMAIRLYDMVEDMRLRNDSRENLSKMINKGQT